MIKKYILRSSLLIIAISLVVSSCDVTYVPDPIDPRLPKYTEDGNNVGGALINGQLWKSNGHYNIFGIISSSPPLIVHNALRDSLSFGFWGDLENRTSMQISFGLRGFGVTNLAEMTKLNGEKITLDGVTNVARLSNPNGPEDCAAPGIGQLYLRSVKYDAVGKRLFLSGTFGFNQNDLICGENTVTYGRFDFTVVGFY